MESLTLALLCFLFVTAKSTTCNRPIDLNTATSSQLTTLPYITPHTAQLIIDARPICSPLDLTGRRKIKGITSNRLNKNWNWFKNQDCSDTCCLAKAHCESQGQDSTILDDPSTTYHFQADDWSECTTKCGPGTQKRNVQCLDSNDNIVDEINCVTLDKNPKKRICNNNPCPTYKWVADKFCDCVADSQGVCMQTRPIKCYDTANDKPVNDLKCDTQNNKPDDTRECNDCKKGKSSTRSRRRLLNKQLQTTRINGITVTVDLLNEYNSDACNTNIYTNVDKTLITRRACKTNIFITVDGMSTNIDKSLFDLDITLQAETNEKVYDINYAYTSKDSNSGWIIIDIANDGYIGEFKYKLYFQNTQIADFTLFVLFNPYSTSSEVYIESLIDREEYVENEFGLIWRGSANYNSAMTWAYDHLDFPNLKISMNALKRLTLSYRNNIVIISRQITNAIYQDLCYGRWDSPIFYDDPPYSRAPWDWTGTGELFDIYRITSRNVRYCQCWVFAGMLTTIGRALGIPTRTVTNFWSAHDGDFNRAIDQYYIKSNGYLTKVGQEGVWNYHAWNEMYFKRNDFIEDEYNIAEWQVVDSTPQEHSYGGNPALRNPARGVYQMGPASISLIRNNKNPHLCKSDTVNGKERFGCFDTEFVISETNANYNVWIKNEWDSKYTLDRIVSHAYDQPIGALINTKKPGAASLNDCVNEAIGDCRNDYIDLTCTYKECEPSQPGQPTDTTNFYIRGDKKRRLLSEKDYDMPGFEYDIQIVPNKDMIVKDNSQDIMDRYGGDYTYGMIGININSFENDILDIYCRLSVAGYDYSGKQIGDEIKNKVMENVKLNVGQSVNECEMYLYYNDYEKWVSDGVHVSEVPYTFKFTATVSLFKDGDQDEPYGEIIEQRDVLVCDPEIKLNDRIICKRGLKWFQPMHMKGGIKGDGFCDEAFNNNENNYDNGDCCKQTCVGNTLYNCPYFNCIDPNVNNKNKDFKKCPKIKSFINHVKEELVESGVCTQVWRNVIENNEKSPTNGLLFENANECMDQILIMKNDFGDFESCYKEAFHALDFIKIKPIIKIVADCINNYNKNIPDTKKASKSLNNKCYNTLDKNPCKNEENFENNLLYFKSCTSCCNFIQCDAINIGNAYDMPCGIGKYWDNNNGQCKPNNGQCNENCGQRKY